MNKELPEGWEWTSLGEVTDNPQYGWTTRAINEGNLHLLRTTDISPGKINWECVPFCEEDPQNIEKYLLKDGDIVISRAGSVGYSYLIINPQRSIFASYLIRFKPLINQYYLYYFLKSPDYWNSIYEKSIGIAMANVNASKLKQIILPMPPLAEQKRIVNKIEELFTNLDKGIEYLKTAQAELKLTRQSVLKYALEGRLTEDWREKHKGEIEPASVLLEKINAERKKEGKYKDLPPIVTDGTPKLPEGWTWARLGGIISIEYGKGLTEDKRDKNGKYPVYGSNGIVGYHSNYYVENNCIVIGRKGAVGKVHLTNSPCWPIDTTYYTISPKELSMNFLFYLLSHMRLEKLDKSTAIPGINRNDVYSKVIILPSLAEQQQIVEVIENYYSILDNMEKAISESLNQTSGIRQSILKKAFEGRLVSQDPNDEPASVLLEKIKAEKLMNEQKTGLEKKNKFVKEKYRQMGID